MGVNMRKEFKKLVKKNGEIRKEIIKLLSEDLSFIKRDNILNEINLLIENEIKQEELCNN